MIDGGFPLAGFRGLTIAGLAIVVTGCGEELGRVPIRVAQVRGIVREGTRPLSGGWIEFFPVNGTVGNLRSARLRPDGSFEADGVAVGENLIRLVNSPFRSPRATQLFGAYSSPIRRTISDRPTAPIEVDLVEEAIRFERTQGRRNRSESNGSGEPP